MRCAIKNVLLIEDDPKDALLFSNILENDESKNEYFVTHVNCAEKIISKDMEGKYDVIFLDMNLPGVSGLEAIEKIQSKVPNIPIVILTASNDEEIAANAIRKGCQDYLVKGHNDAEAVRRSIRYAIDRKGFENKIINLARYDTLTNVVKREVIYDRMEKAISLSKRNGIKIAVLFIDLDNFKSINDTYGHIVGDHVLKETANRLKGCVRSHDTIARFGGDEFIILLEGLRSEAEDCDIVAKRVIKNISRPIQYENDNITISCSLGISIYPECADNSENLILSADAALQLAKQEGKNKYTFYNKILNQKILRTNILNINLKKAVECGEIEAYYHPVIDVSKNKIVSAEALARWDCKKLGSISPVEFIPLAEKSGLINELGELMLKKVSGDYHELKKIVKQPFKVSVNISAKQFEQKDLAEKFIDILLRSNISAKNVSFEITENLLLDNTEKIMNTLMKFKDAGISIHLDDFGTGYSSLSYLGRVPVDTLKIDRSFVSDITKNRKSQVISKAIMGIAKNLNLNVISEGVENKKQLDYLQSIGCDKIQGYYFAKPMPLNQFKKWIEVGFKNTTTDRVVNY